MNRQEELDKIVKHAAIQAIVELHQEIGLDKILLEASEAYGRGERDPVKVADKISKKFGLNPVVLCPTCSRETRVEDDGVYLSGFCAIHGRFQLTTQDVVNYHESLKAKAERMKHT